MHRYMAVTRLLYDRSRSRLNNRDRVPFLACPLSHRYHSGANKMKHRVIFGCLALAVATASALADDRQDGDQDARRMVR